MKKVVLLFFLIIELGVLSGCIIAYPDGVPIQYYPYEAPVQVYYANPPFSPGYPWQYYYTMPTYPGFVFFYGDDGGGHYRHYYHQRGGDGRWGGRNEFRGTFRGTPRRTR